jgi:hypothetical protein
VNDNYLWDRSGEPDPDIERLEHLLGELRHHPGALDYSRIPATAPAPPRGLIWRWRSSILAGAACAAVVLVAAGFWWRSPKPVPAAAPSTGLWLVRSLTGLPSVSGAPLQGELRVGGHGVIETDSASTARLSATGVGMIDLGPGTRLRTVPSSAGEYRLALDRGTLDAHIWAAPGRFSVDTASATALDLGCSYRLEVTLDGNGLLHVTLGWVGLGQHEVESLVPQGAVCALKQGAGPGIPHFDDASGALVEALSTIDGSPDRMPAAALETALAAARPRDAFTLWHMLRRAAGADADRIYERLAALSPPPAGVTRESVLAKNRTALDSWWNTFGLGDAALFGRWRARAVL